MDANNNTPFPLPAGAAKPKVVVPVFSFRANGWPYVRIAGLTFAVTALLSAALIGIVHWRLLQARPETELARARQMASQQRLANAETERIEIRDFQPRFEQLRGRGFVGRESRLAMVEAIQAIQRRHQLMPVTFSFAPQQLVALEPALLGEPLKLKSTGITLRMELLHEMDLVHFLQDLKAYGFFSVRECLVSSTGDSASDRLVARLRAECTLYWLSVDDDAAPTNPNVAPAAQ
jgi:hypothetical protein